MCAENTAGVPSGANAAKRSPNVGSPPGGDSDGYVPTMVSSTPALFGSYGVGCHVVLPPVGAEPLDVVGTEVGFDQRLRQLGTLGERDEHDSCRRPLRQPGDLGVEARRVLVIAEWT